MEEAARKMMRATVIGQEELAERIFSMWLTAGAIAREALPGQFILVYTDDTAHLLGRPVSICETDPERGRIRLVYRVAGAGTAEFSRRRPGDKLRVLGPLGNGFPLYSDKKALIVGGGIGIPPMLALAEKLDTEKEIVLGYKDELFLNREFEPYGRVSIATEDGRTGVKGTVLDAILKNELMADVIYACGPKPMLGALKDYAAENGLECFISLEEKMACGIGACLSCVCGCPSVDEQTNVHRKRVCRDGPVFAAGEVIL